MKRDIPEVYQATYKRAMRGKSRKAGVRAFCQECVGYQREEVRLCTDVYCPLYLYRPYKEEADFILEDSNITK